MLFIYKALLKPICFLLVERLPINQLDKDKDGHIPYCMRGPEKGIHSIKRHAHLQESGKAMFRDRQERVNQNLNVG